MARAAANGKRHATQQSLNGAIKNICNIMRRSNCAGAMQYVPELTWIDTERNPLDVLDRANEISAETVDDTHSWTVSREQIDSKNYDLKEANPNAKAVEDIRRPEEILDLIEQKGREIQDAIAQLRAIKP
jgi:hypothetical protein